MARLADIVFAPWAIHPEMHREVVGIYDRHVRGEKIDIHGLESRLGRPLANSQPASYELRDGVAVVGIDGVLAKRMNLLSQISGGSSTQIIGRQFDEAMADPNVRAVVLAVDSPGGTVDGTQELADKIYAARGTKPIVAVADGSMASAAYWIGSAADKIYASSDTAAIGSIGVRTEVVDRRAADAAAGVTRKVLTAGKYKAVGDSSRELTAEDEAVVQDQLDHVYSVFVDAVARHRGVTADQVLTDMADGRIFLGQQAVKAGLVDGVATLDAIIAQLAAGETPDSTARTSRAKAAEGAGGALEAVTQTSMMEQKMTLTIDTLRAEHPELFEAVQAEGIAMGAAAERDRILAVKAQALAGHEALVEKMMFDGKTTGPEAAVAILAAERSKMTGRLEGLRADAESADKVPPAAPPAGESDDSDLPVEERCQRAWDKNPAIRAEYGNSFEAFVAYERAAAAGRARVKAGK